MRRRQAYALKAVQKTEPATEIGLVVCPYCNQSFKKRGIHHHKIKCQKIQR